MQCNSDLVYFLKVLRVIMSFIQYAFLIRIYTYFLSQDYHFREVETKSGFLITMTNAHLN